MEGTLSPSDVALINGNGGMWGNNGMEWLFAIILLGAVGGGGLFGVNARANAATTEDLASGFNFSALQNKTNDILAAVNNVNQVISNAICQLGYQVLEQFSAMKQAFSECCCQTLRAIDGVKFDMANYAAASNANTVAVGQKILDKLCDMEKSQIIAQKDAVIDQQAQRISALEMDARFCGIPRINPYGYGIYQYPTCNPCGYQNGAY